MSVEKSYGELNDVVVMKRREKLCERHINLLVLTYFLLLVIAAIFGVLFLL
jgi:hypothetical protein